MYVRAYTTKSSDPEVVLSVNELREAHLTAWDLLAWAAGLVAEAPACQLPKSKLTYLP
jgi:hypothetical protein